MRNWIIVLLIFIMPLGLYAYLDAKAQSEKMCTVEQEKAAASNKIVKTKIIKFSSPMCSECKEAASEMEKALKNYNDVVVVEEINVVESTGKDVKYNKDAIKKYKVTLVPTLVFLDKDGNVAKKHEGAMKSDEIVKTLDGIK